MVVADVISFWHRANAGGTRLDCFYVLDFAEFFDNYLVVPSLALKLLALSTLTLSLKLAKLNFFELPVQIRNKLFPTTTTFNFASLWKAVKRLKKVNRPRSAHITHKPLQWHRLTQHTSNTMCDLLDTFIKTKIQKSTKIKGKEIPSRQPAKFPCQYLSLDKLITKLSRRPQTKLNRG